MRTKIEDPCCKLPESTEVVKGPFDCGGQPGEVERMQKDDGSTEMCRLNQLPEFALKKGDPDVPA